MLFQFVMKFYFQLSCFTLSYKASGKQTTSEGRGESKRSKPSVKGYEEDMRKCWEQLKVYASIDTEED